MTEQPAQRVFVKEDGSARIHCDACGLLKTVHVKNSPTRAPVVRVRCVCSAVFPVRFEFRTAFRKSTNLDGIYKVLSEEDEQDGLDIVELGEKTTNCRIENLSMHGAGFTVLNRHKIEIADRIIISCVLDNKQKARIIKTGTVRRVHGSYVGMLFDESPYLDQDLGFYLLP